MPSGDQSANPASVPGRSGLQRALLSVSSAQKCSGAGKLATPSGVSRAARSAVPCWPPFQGTELAALSTPEASLERLIPLVGHPAAWEPLPSVSHWDLPEQTLVPSLRDDMGLRTVISNRRLLRQSWGQGPGLVSWGRAVYTALHGARLSSVPSGDQSANPASVQGAAVSSERFSQSLPPRNVAELGSSPPLRGSLEQLDRPSPAGPPFQGTELAALSTRVWGPSFP